MSLYSSYVTNAKKKFVSAETLSQHKLKHHNKEQQIFKCSECTTTCTTPYTLITHMKKHAKDLTILEAKSCVIPITVLTKGKVLFF